MTTVTIPVPPELLLLFVGFFCGFFIARLIRAIAWREQENRSQWPDAAVASAEDYEAVIAGMVQHGCLFLEALPDSTDDQIIHEIALGRDSSGAQVQYALSRIRHNELQKEPKP